MEELHQGAGFLNRSLPGTSKIQTGGGCSTRTRLYAKICWTLKRYMTLKRSGWCLREEALYTASVLYHEVLHLVCREMRYPEVLEDRYRLLLEDEGITIEKAGRDYGLQEERFVYTKELDFLIRFRAPRRLINKTREDLRLLEETCQDLK